MAPARKKQRTAQSNSKNAGHLPDNISQVAPVRIELRDFISLVHQGRHGFSEDRKFPLHKGGSFLDLVQRCWADETSLIEDSLDFVKRIGLMASDSSVDDFTQKYLTLKDY